MAKIKVYDSRGFTQRYMASPELGQLMKGDFSQFFIVRVEEMYRLVQEAVPASRSTGHTFIYITEGEAIMTIGSRRYKTRRGELLLVPAGQVFSFGQGDVNKGYLCHFQDALLQGIYGKNALIRDFVHGLLFLLFVINTLSVGVEHGWKFGTTTWKVLVACVVPFGTFYIDRKILAPMHKTMK